MGEKVGFVRTQHRRYQTLAAIERQAGPVGLWTSGADRRQERGGPHLELLPTLLTVHGPNCFTVVDHQTQSLEKSGENYYYYFCGLMELRYKSMGEASKQGHRAHLHCTMESATMVSSTFPLNWHDFVQWQSLPQRSTNH
jgi:hypothetical protein